MPQVELSKIAAELAVYMRSDDPIKQALLELYRAGEITPSGIKDGQISWSATDAT
jgi:hypothetical protein